MEKVLVLMLMLLSICQVSTASFRVLLEDEVAGKVNLPAENPPSKDKVDKLTVASNTNNSSNQSKLAPPDAIGPKKNKTIEPAPPARTETTRNPKQENVTVLAPPASQETNKSANSGEKEGGAVTDDNSGTKADTGTKKDENVGTIKGLCDMAPEKCFDDNYIACLQHPGNGSREMFLVVQNKGENDISLDVRSTPSLVLDSKKLDIAKHEYRKVKIQISDASNAGDITINAGKRDCILHIEPTTTANFDWQKSFQQFASYATQLTPIYGAYLILSIGVISLVIWGCCKFVRGRRRSGSSPPFQQLEMGGIHDDYQPSSENADVVNTADGWENGWDDNWDDEEAVLGRPAETNNGVSANGMSSSRSYDNINSKDGWDVDWDD